MTIPHGQASGGTLGHIRSILPSLIPSEQRVAAEFVNSPESVLDASTAAMAARAGTSAATVSRTCQNLGFRGYQHLRLLLAREMGSRSSDQRSQTEAGDRGTVRSAFDNAAQALAEAYGTVDFDAFDQAVTALSGARRLLIAGTGGSGPVAQGLAVRFLASERVCEAPADAMLQLLAANGLRPGDACLVISESGSNALTLTIARGARDAGAAVVGLTAYARTPLAEVADIALVTGATYGQWKEDRVGSNIVQIVLLGALHTAVMERVQGNTAVSDRMIETVAAMTDEQFGDAGGLTGG
ncbi:MurR/RpiR family transcriptional regulator [Brevibacterium album]|uniref:MurR/RpiR family transcriptional regulator n=1 Tax=Brevibacterium album TaxID=417948 RepID=UPI000427983D|nr:MurR/RpiR family transcriptional regulator [Brevibacterium album]